MIVLLALAASSLSCRGDLPALGGEPFPGKAAVLIRGRILLPTGETEYGRMALNLESETRRYRLRVDPGRTNMYRIDPGVYRIHPARNLWGGPQAHIRITANARVYRAPFPRDILRRGPVTVKPGAVVSLGVLEARIAETRQGSAAKASASLDDGLEARRRLVEDMIRRTMDSDVPAPMRDNAVAWIQALEQSLIRIQGSVETKPSYKPAP